MGLVNISSSDKKIEAALDAWQTKDCRRQFEDLLGWGLGLGLVDKFTQLTICIVMRLQWKCRLIPTQIVMWAEMITP